MQKKYECECKRSNISPKQFYTYCRHKLQKKCDVDIECWVEYENWAKPYSNVEAYSVKHENWDVPLTETVKYMPFDIQFFLQNTYNFIMEFEFDCADKGCGYMYVFEAE